MAKSEKPEQWHFYVPPTLRKTCEGVFEAQGVKVSEGIKRLMETLIEMPQEVQILLLKQAKGSAAAALAREVLSQGRGVAQDPETADIRGEVIPPTATAKKEPPSEKNASGARRGK